jgi:hypothetical protein
VELVFFAFCFVIVLHITNDINQFWFLPGQTNHFDIKHNGRIGRDTWFSGGTRSSFLSKGQFTLVIFFHDDNDDDDDASIYNAT